MIPSAQSVCDDLAQTVKCCRRAGVPVPQVLLDSTAALCASGLTVAPATDAHNATDPAGRWWMVKGIVPGQRSIGLRARPDYLLVLRFRLPSRRIREVYRGPAHALFDRAEGGRLPVAALGQINGHEHPAAAQPEGARAFAVATLTAKSCNMRFLSASSADEACRQVAASGRVDSEVLAWPVSGAGSVYKLRLDENGRKRVLRADPGDRDNDRG